MVLTHFVISHALFLNKVILVPQFDTAHLTAVVMSWFDINGWGKVQANMFEMYINKHSVGISEENMQSQFFYQKPSICL